MPMRFTLKTASAGLAAGLIMLVATDGAFAHGNGGCHPPVHGPGSSHNPIVHHPVHGPGSSHNPILVTKPVVRDHRNHGGAHGGGINGGSSSSQGGVTVTSGSGRNKVVVPTQVGEPIFTNPGNGLYDGPPPPVVRDHR